MTASHKLIPLGCGCTLEVPVLITKNTVLHSLVCLEGKMLFYSYWTTVTKAVRALMLCIFVQGLIPLRFAFLARDVFFAINVI